MPAELSSGALGSFLRGRELALLGALAVLTSLTEGLGLVLLVPILQAVGGTGAIVGSDPVSRAWRALGLPPDLAALLVIFVGLIAVRAMLLQGRTIAELAIRERATARLRERLFGTLLHAGWRHLTRLNGGDTLSAVLGLIDQAGFAMQSLLALLAASLTLLAIGAGALMIAPIPALLFTTGGVFVLCAYAGLRRRAARDGERLAQANADFFGFFAERLAALRLIKSFGREDAEIGRAGDVGRAISRARIDHQKNLSLGQAALEIGAAAVLAGGAWIAVVRWHAEASTLLPLIALFARSLPLLQTTQASWQNWLHARPAVARVAALLDTADASREPAGSGAPAPDPAIGLSVEDASVHHPGRASAALRGITLDLPVGSTTLLAGPSGAGKSTLADLVGGMILPDSGRVLVDGRPLDEVGLAAWRLRVAYVQQEPLLFHATIRDNLTWAAPGADEAALAAALRKASAEFVFDLPDGFDTVVGDRGGRLSGGERQRIALARSLLRSPALLILDEVTSALDPENEAAVTSAVERLKGSMIILIIGHRGALSALADRTVQLNGGRLVTKDDSLRVDFPSPARC